jgi:hypothetical protein
MKKLADDNVIRRALADENMLPSVKRGEWIASACPV